MKSQFVHLSVYTSYTLDQSIIAVNDLSGSPAFRNVETVGVTDKMSLGAYMDLVCTQDLPFKAIIGADVKVGESPQDFSWIKLIAYNQEGLSNLERIVRYQTRFDHGNRFDIGLVLENSSGLIALSRGRHGQIGKYLLAGQYEEAEQYCHQWKDRFENNFYLEIQRTGHPDDACLNKATLTLSTQSGIPVVATHDVYFLEKEHYFCALLKTALQRNTTFSEVEAQSWILPEHYLKSPEAMKKLFADIPEAVANTTNIADQCRFAWRSPRIFPVSANFRRTSIRELAETALEARFDHPFYAPAREVSPLPAVGKTRNCYRKRVAMEIEFIEKLQLSSAFLKLSEMCRAVKGRGHAMSPGEGWVLLSLVAYLLDIVDMDPVAHELAFDVDEIEALCRSTTSGARTLREFLLKMDGNIHEDFHKPFLSRHPDNSIAAVTHPNCRPLPELIGLITRALEKDKAWKKEFMFAILNGDCYADGMVSAEEYSKSGFCRREPMAIQLYLALLRIAVLPLSIAIEKNTFALSGDRLEPRFRRYLKVESPLFHVDGAVARKLGMTIFRFEPCHYLSILGRLQQKLRKETGLHSIMQTPYLISASDWVDLFKKSRKYQMNRFFKADPGEDSRAIVQFRSMEESLANGDSSEAETTCQGRVQSGAFLNRYLVLMDSILIEMQSSSQRETLLKCPNYRKAIALRLIHIEFALRKAIHEFPGECDSIVTGISCRLDRGLGIGGNNKLFSL
jgi:hypothetical protein